jgi:hypothetical protein
MILAPVTQSPGWAFKFVMQGVFIWLDCGINPAEELNIFEFPGEHVVQMSMWHFLVICSSMLTRHSGISTTKKGWWLRNMLLVSKGAHPLCAPLRRGFPGKISK